LSRPRTDLDLVDQAGWLRASDHLPTLARTGTDAGAEAGAVTAVTAVAAVTATALEALEDPEVAAATADEGRQYKTARKLIRSSTST